MSEKGKKKILLLGGSYAQIPAIESAIKHGLYTILCDNLIDNPGQHLADEYYCVSTTDKDAILELAGRLEVDYILAYSSDPAAPTAAYVSQKLGLPGNTIESVNTLSEKHLFRRMLRDNGFNCPNFLTYNHDEVNEINDIELNYPLIVKPADSSGSKGVGLIQHIDEFKYAAKYALSFSKSKRIVVEEYVVADRRQLHGDGFVVDGHLIFCYLGEHHYNTEINPFVPYSTTWPSERDEVTLEKVHKVVEKVIQTSGFKHGPVNIEVRVNQDQEIYVMEIGPRNGGNFVPILMNHATGFNMVDAALRDAMGEKITIESVRHGSAAYYVLHSAIDGILDKIHISDELNQYVIETHLYRNKGQFVNSFQGANAAIGILLLGFPTPDILKTTMRDASQQIRIDVRTQN